MRIVDEYDYLIHLIKCAIKKDKPCEIPQGLSFNLIYKYALAHDVANLAFYSVEMLETKPDLELYEKWQKRRDMAVTRGFNQSFAADEIREVFKKEGMRWLEVQGTRMKKLYPAPEYRTMSDLDFIIDPENLKKSKVLLESLGYECKLNGDIDLGAFRRPNIHVEMHTVFFPPDWDFGNVMDPPFTHIVVNPDGGCEAEITEFYLYSILHLAKHYFREGCGIRRLLDVYLLDEFLGDSLDSEYLNTRYEKAGITEFVGDIKALAQYWFGNGSEPENLSEMKAYITSSNLHGTLEHKVKNNLKKELDSGKKNAKLRYVFKRIFQDKELIYIRYPFIRKCKILLPLGWAMRILYGLTHFKEKRIGEEIKMMRNVDQR